ncbi:hypothetical protein KSD_68500 [Ktedonobacter sp. SOSP1-85]|uniref:HIT family protein n=1 Tax=Ktedonobacter sp. SOSP1-85 TaxID=2778367 RepID=UPI0019167BB3|nr:hypothetical protein [Ktedonobacter sp. SOSP1-85]GHO79079.1 hypothetical protein KSD_68500 [Ktedonobacter sp. SOSP1-85]
MECLSCLSLSGERSISPGPIVYEGTYWVVDHAYPTIHLGWLVILPRRHVEALHELSREEFLELAEIQYRLAQTMHLDSCVQKESPTVYQKVGERHQMMAPSRHFFAIDTGEYMF